MSIAEVSVDRGCGRAPGDNMFPLLIVRQLPELRNRGVRAEMLPQHGITQQA